MVGYIQISSAQIAWYCLTQKWPLATFIQFVYVCISILFHHPRMGSISLSIAWAKNPPRRHRSNEAATWPPQAHAPATLHGVRWVIPESSLGPRMFSRKSYETNMKPSQFLGLSMVVNRRGQGSIMARNIRCLTKAFTEYLWEKAAPTTKMSKSASNQKAT